MTIAAAVLSKNGITIAADTKEGYGDTHTYVDKISTAVGSTGIGAIASSGNGELLDYITPHIQKLIAEGDWKTPDEFAEQLRAKMAALYRSDSINSYPRDKAEDLYTQFLVAVRHTDGTECRLFIVGSTLVTEATQLATVIGCGPLREFVEEMGNVTGYTLPKAKIAALVAVHEAKRRYSDVGGKISICTLLTHGAFDNESESRTVQLESLVDRARQVTNRMTLVTLDSSAPTERFSRTLKEAHTQLRELHQELKELDAREIKERRRSAVRVRKRYAKLIGVRNPQ